MKERPIIFGEVLFDHFPDGSAVLGGAPFNVAWHLQGFGLNPLLISCLGDDEDGRRVLDAMAGWDMDRSGIQADASHSTGVVQVTLNDGQPSFDIVADVAYDHIDPKRLPAAVEGSLLYHGTLAARSMHSRTALSQLRDAADLPVFVDINLRAPWWDHNGVEKLIHGARWLKLNEDELFQIELTAPADAIAAAKRVKSRFGLEWLIVTRGSKGAMIFGPDGMRTGEVPTVDLVDAVGAGDAFSAVVILGFTRGWSASETLARALQFAAAICRVRGATSTDRSLYRQLLSEWKA